MGNPRPSSYPRPRLVRVAGKPGEHEHCGLELIDCGSVLVVCNPGFRLSVGRNIHPLKPKKLRRATCLWFTT